MKFAIKNFVGYVTQQKLHTQNVLNQARACCIKLILCRLSVCVFVCVCVYVCVCVCVCLYLRLLITSGMMWHDMDLLRLIEQVLQLLYSNGSHLSLMGVALTLIRIVETNPIRVS